MKTKKLPFLLFCSLFITAIFFSVSCLAQFKNESPPQSQGFLSGAIVIKVAEGVSPFETQDQKINFGIPSLDEKVSKFKISKLAKRFKHKPINKNSGLPDLSRIYRLEFPKSQNVHEVAKAFALDPNIEYAEAVPLLKLAFVPNDSMYSIQQHLPQIMAPEAWDIHKGEDGDEVVIAIVDTGVDWLHPDLTENCWQNLGEDADGDGMTLEYNNGVWERDPDDLNGLDDDGNGFIDDVIGWDFHDEQIHGDGSNPDPSWYEGVYEHGTHCAGIAAGTTNNSVGISSVSYNVKYMALQTDAANNTVLYGWDGIIYAAENGADIISNSWGSPVFSQLGRDVVDYAIGLGSIVLAAAHNYNTDNIYYPASYPGVISVAAVNQNDTRAAFTNYGVWVDIAAPGVQILSTVTENKYASWGGTSMATPMVAGQFGLLKSFQPTWTNNQLTEQIIGTADNIDGLNPGYEKALGSGRINAYRTLAEDNIEVLQELRLGLLDCKLTDEDGDDMLESGEIVSVSIKMRNYAHYVSTGNATFTLSSPDPDLTITTSSFTDSIPADAEFEFTNVFEFKIDANAKLHFANLFIEVSSDLPIIYGSETEIAAIIEPAGFFVWEGSSFESDYSGTFIKNYLEGQGHEIFYSNSYPASFQGFDATFLSFGNIGKSGERGTYLQYQYSQVIQDYLEHGGRLFTDGSPFLSVPEYDGFPNANEFASLFGASEVDFTFNYNPVSKLSGIDGSLTENMVFNSSNQIYNYYIDRIIAADGAHVSFAENNYGNISIYNQGEYGQKTFHMGYSLAELVDVDPYSSRYNIMLKVMDFFGYPENENYVVANFNANRTEGRPDLHVNFTDWSISDENTNIVGWAWDFDEDGVIDDNDQNPSFSYTKGGVYDVMLIVYGIEDIDTLVKKDYITVRSGILVYEGQKSENGYSGEYIYNYLQNNWYDEIGYTTRFPVSLIGYDVVFLSFGNTGMRGTTLEPFMREAIIDFCHDKGKIYLEGANALSSNDYLWLYFGLNSTENGEKNSINDLSGGEEAITYGQQFLASEQLSNRSIDKYTIFDDAPFVQEAFTESDYGTVAVQHDGTSIFGNKTFCMSYALADLVDGENTTNRAELLQRILNFFDVVADLEEASDIGSNNLNVYPNPAAERISIQLKLDKQEVVQIVLSDLSGRQISSVTQNLQSGTHKLDFELVDLKPGMYYFTVKSNLLSEAIKWVKVKR